ncbi:MAG: helix-turn-helix domain-containing protein [Dehalobacterium sp.]
MGQKSKVSFEGKLRAVQDYFSREKGFNQICSDMQINKRSFRDWVRKYQLYGEQGLRTSVPNRSYSVELKLQAVTEYKEGQGSLDQICNKYHISTHSILLQWIKKYNGHVPFKSHHSQGDRRMIKGRKTTYEERIEIVAFCITNDDNYQKAAEEFQVSYQQVYTWVRKYKELGPDALVDCRGKRKKSEEMNESEKQAAQLKLLEAENKRLQMEIDFLKKLDEVERRRLTLGNSKKTDI